MLEKYLKQRQAERGMLLMTHIVIGYPDMSTSLQLVEEMVAAGVDLMELQIPFSEPIADGPVILHANQEALKHGVNVENCFEFAADVAKRFPIPFLFMSYYNILFKGGVQRFVDRSAAAGMKGAIVPDLPPEEAMQYTEAMQRAGMDPIFIFSPRSTDERMREIAAAGSGFVYCVARKGVTGAETAFSNEIGDYLRRARAATALPLAVGFGVKSRQDVEYLSGKADIAVVGTESLRVLDRDGPKAVGSFLAGLRP